MGKRQNRTKGIGAILRYKSKKQTIQTEHHTHKETKNKQTKKERTPFCRSDARQQTEGIPRQKNQETQSQPQIPNEESRQVSQEIEQTNQPPIRISQSTETQSSQENLTQNTQAEESAIRQRTTFENRHQDINPIQRPRRERKAPTKLNDYEIY